MCRCDDDSYVAETCAVKLNTVRLPPRQLGIPHRMVRVEAKTRCQITKVTKRNNTVTHNADWQALTERINPEVIRNRQRQKDEVIFRTAL